MKFVSSFSSYTENKSLSVMFLTFILVNSYILLYFIFVLWFVV